MPETHLKLKYREVSFTHNLCRSCPIVLNFCAEHGSGIADAMDVRDFTRFEFKTKSYIAQLPDTDRFYIDHSVAYPWHAYDDCPGGSEVNLTSIGKFIPLIDGDREYNHNHIFASSSRIIHQRKTVGFVCKFICYPFNKWPSSYHLPCEIHQRLVIWYNCATGWNTAINFINIDK